MKVLLRRCSLVVVMLAATMIISACGKPQLANALNWNLDSFTYTNQEDKEFGTKDLTNKVWIANFIFTNCETVCPPITAHMAKLQRMMKKENVPVEFVSFSIDPENDTPEALKSFAQQFTEDFSNWTFLTGYSQETIEKQAKTQFHELVQKTDASTQVTHGTHLFLVNKEGKIMKSYSGFANVPYKEIVQDAKTLNE
ncbi:SCO family protein [Priestia koreensis]|uniref:SCO family protein n=1 Tax=Priestia koreensis TaxID=284581 RepID=UPI003D6BAB54